MTASAVTDSTVVAPRVMVVGSGWRFTSGISYYTCRLTNAFAEVTETSALLMRQLVPTRLYPGRSRVGRPVNALSYLPSVPVFDGVDWFWGTTIRDARRFIDEQRPDVLVLQWWTGAVLHSYLHLARAVKRRGGRVIIEWHEVQDTGEARIPGVAQYAVAAMKRLLRISDAHLVHSEYDLDLLRRTYDLPDERVAIAPHGPYDHYVRDGAEPAGDAVDAAEGEPRPSVDDADFVLLYFGVIRPYKGVEDLIAAFDLLPADVRSRMRLVLVGETWEGWTLPKEAAAASPNADRITLVDRYVDDVEVAAHFAAADAVVLPYRRSSSSGPLHIAMSSGLPVVVSRVGGLEASAGDYEGVTFVPPADPEALAEAISALPAMRGRRFADPHSWETTLAAYDSLFARIGVPPLPASAVAASPVHADGSAVG